MIANPVLRKELLMRLRLRQSSAARVGLFICMALVIGFVYYNLINSLRQDPNPDSGHTAWQFLLVAQFLLIGLIAPSSTANAITQEREQQTWEMLIFTRLQPAEIILGKLFGRLVTMGLMLLAFFPLMVYSALHANHLGPGTNEYITLGEFVGAYLVLIITAVFFATSGLFMSWLTKRTLYAIMMSYTFLIGGLLITTTLITLSLQALFTDSDFVTRCPLMWLNPGMILYYIMTPRSASSADGLRFLVYGLIAYVALTLLMLWRMIAGFRRFAYEG